MAGPTPATAGEARIEAATAAAVASEATAIENAVAVEIPAVVVAAQEAIAEAEDLQEGLALAAMQTELGQRIVAVDTMVSTCRNDLAGLAEKTASLTTRLDQLAADLTSAIARLPPIVVEASSIPTPLPAEPMATTTIVNPAENPAPIAAAPEARAAKKVRLI